MKKILLLTLLNIFSLYSVSSFAAVNASAWGFVNGEIDNIDSNSSLEDLNQYLDYLNTLETEVSEYGDECSKSEYKDLEYMQTKLSNKNIALTEEVAMLDKKLGNEEGRYNKAKTKYDRNKNITIAATSLTAVSTGVALSTTAANKALKGTKSISRDKCEKGRDGKFYKKYKSYYTIHKAACDILLAEPTSTSSNSDEATCLTALISSSQSYGKINLEEIKIYTQLVDKKDSIEGILTSNSCSSSIPLKKECLYLTDEDKKKYECHSYTIEKNLISSFYFLIEKNSIKPLTKEQIDKDVKTYKDNNAKLKKIRNKSENKIPTSLSGLDKAIAIAKLEHLKKVYTEEIQPISKVNADLWTKHKYLNDYYDIPEEIITLQTEYGKLAKFEYGKFEKLINDEWPEDESKSDKKAKGKITKETVENTINSTANSTKTAVKKEEVEIKKLETVTNGSDKDIKSVENKIGTANTSLEDMEKIITKFTTDMNAEVAKLDSANRSEVVPLITTEVKDMNTIVTSSQKLIENANKTLKTLKESSQQSTGSPLDAAAKNAVENIKLEDLKN